MTAADEAVLENAQAWCQLRPSHCVECDRYRQTGQELATWAARLAWSMRETLRWQVLDKILQQWVEWDKVVWGFATRFEMIEPGTMASGILTRLDPTQIERVTEEINSLIDQDVIMIRYNSITDLVEYRWRRDDDDKPR